MKSKSLLDKTIYPLRYFKHMKYASVHPCKGSMNVNIEYEDGGKIKMSTAYGVVNYRKGKK